MDHVSQRFCRIHEHEASLLASAGKALIAQNKGGGHGELGYHLALKLIEKDISVTLLQDGAGKNRDKQPFARCCRRTSLNRTEILSFYIERPTFRFPLRDVSASESSHAN